MNKLAAVDLLAALVLEDGRRWGEVAAGFQWEDARAVLDPDGTPYHFLTRSRGSSKTADLAGVATAVLLAQAPAGSRLYALAADRDQGRLLLDSIEGYATRTPELRDALRVDAFKVTATRGGSVLEVLAADAPGAWGLRPFFLVVDELAGWQTTMGPRRLWEAVTTAVAKVAGCRMVVLTSAGDPGHWSHGVLEHAKSDPLWRVNEVPGPAPWADPDRLAEQRRRLPASSWSRLFENRWTAGEDRLTVAEDLETCTVLEGPLPPRRGVRYVIGLDVGTVNDRTAAVVAHAERMEGGDGSLSGVRVVVDRVQTWQGSRANPVQLAAVGEWVGYVSREYGGARVVYDPHQAVELAQRLAKQGVTCEKFDFTAASVGRLGLTLYQCLRNRTIALPDDEELLDELRNVRLVERSPGVYRLDHDAGQHDDRAVALALVATRLLERPPAGEAGVVGSVTFTGPGAQPDDDEWQDPRGHTHAEWSEEDVRADFYERATPGTRHLHRALRIEEPDERRRESTARGARPSPSSVAPTPFWWKRLVKPSRCFRCLAPVPEGHELCSREPDRVSCANPHVALERFRETFSERLELIESLRGPDAADRFLEKYGGLDDEPESGAVGYAAV